MLVTTSSSRMLARNYWQDPKTGVSYQVQVQVPTQRMDAPSQVGTVPLLQADNGANLMVRDVARVGKGTMPGEYDRTAMQRYLSITANIQGEDLGRAAQVESNRLFPRRADRRIEVNVETPGQGQRP